MHQEIFKSETDGSLEGRWRKYYLVLILFLGSLPRRLLLSKSGCWVSTSFGPCWLSFQLNCSVQLKPEAGQTRGCTERLGEEQVGEQQSIAGNVPGSSASCQHPEVITKQLMLNMLGGKFHLRLLFQITFLCYSLLTKWSP